MPLTLPIKPAFSPLPPNPASSSSEAALFLLDRSPESASDVSRPSGATALHGAAAGGHAAAVARLLELNPGAAGMVDRTGRTPLHYACKADPPSADTVVRLLAAAPAAAAVQDSDGYTPLHFAAGVPSERDVMLALHAANPAAALTRNNAGEVPLHLATQSVSAVLALLEADPSAAGVFDSNGRLPVQNAVRFHIDEDITLVLLDAYPEGAPGRAPHLPPPSLPSPPSTLHLPTTYPRSTYPYPPLPDPIHHPTRPYPPVSQGRAFPSGARRRARAFICSSLGRGRWSAASRRAPRPKAHAPKTTHFTFRALTLILRLWLILINAQNRPLASE